MGSRPLPLVLALALLATSAQARVVIPHAGKLVVSDASGDAPVDAPRTLRFSLHKAALDAPNDDTLVWEETHEQVAFTNGFYAVDLGEHTDLDPGVLAEHRPLWLEITIFEGSAGGSGVALAPRLRLEPSALSHFAADAAKLGGRDPAEYQLVAEALHEVTAIGALSGKGTGEAPLSITEGSIGTALLENGSVTSEKLAPDAVTAAIFPAGSISLDKLSQTREQPACTDGAVLKLGSTGWACGADVGSGATLPFGVAQPLAQQTSGESATLILSDEGITTQKLAQGAVTAEKLATDPEGLANVTGGAAFAANGRVGIGTPAPAHRFDVAEEPAVNGVGFVSVAANSYEAKLSNGGDTSQLAVGDLVTFANIGSRYVASIVNATTFTYNPPYLSDKTNNNNLTYTIRRAPVRVQARAIVDNASIGQVGHTPSWAGFSHANAVGQESYGLIQRNDGLFTLINKKSGGGHIGFRVDNEDRMTIEDSGRVIIRRKGAGTYNNSALHIVTDTGYATFGSLNTGHFHMDTDRPTFYMHKQLQCNGGCVTYSSREAKKDIVPMTRQEEDEALQTLLGLNLVHFKYKGNVDDGATRLGLIAEETPAPISTGNQSAVSPVDYTTVAVAGIRSQQRTIKALEEENRELRERLERLERALESLK